MTDLFAGIGVELIKAGIASAVGYAAALITGSFVTAAAMPVMVGAIVVLLMGITLNAIDNHYGIKNSIKAGMRYAVDHIQYLPQKLTEIREVNLRNYAERAVVNIAADSVDYIYKEAQAWILRKIKPDGVHFPKWPAPPRTLPPSSLKFPRF